MYLHNDKKEIINKYMSRTFLNKLLAGGRGIEISNAVMEYINSDYRNEGHMREKLVNVLWTPEKKDIKDVFTGKDYNALKYLLGDNLADTFKNVWDRSVMYTYSTGYTRRSYRTKKSPRLYIIKNISKLLECIYLAAKDFTLDKYFNDNKTDYQGISVIADIISVEIDKGNRDVLNKIREIIYNDNNTSILTREIIQGALMSKSEEAHKMIAELLMAAKLQEGLRQSITESMDECSREGFLYVLRVIIENNLSRFSSIVRAFGTWTGLGLDNEKPKTINKCLEAAYNCLSDSSYLNECINSDDNLLIYIGIWATAFDEVEDIADLIDLLLDSSQKYKKLVALQFLYETQFMAFRHRIACRVLKEKDLEVLAFAMLNLFGGITLYSLRSNNGTSSLKSYFNLDKDCHSEELFNRLKAVLDIMPKKEIEFRGSVFPWTYVKLTTASIMDLMIYSVAMSWNNEILETLIDYRDKMSPEARQLFAEVFLKEPKDIRQKNVIIELCGDRSPSVRGSAFRIADSISLSKDDYLLIEDILQYKSGDLRKNAIKLLLKQSGQELSSSIKRLVESKNENKRLGAIDIVNAMDGDNKYKGIYGECLQMISSIQGATQKERMLAESITDNKRVEKTFKNGFLLYDKEKDADIKPIVGSGDFKINAMFSMTAQDVKNILDEFNDLIFKNRELEFEYTAWDGTKITTTLGGNNYLLSIKGDGSILDDYPLADEIRAVVKDCNLENTRLIELDFYINVFHRLNYDEYLPWYSDLADDILKIDKLKPCLEYMKQPNYHKITQYIKLLVNEASPNDRFNTGKSILEYIYIVVPEDKHYAKYKKEGGYYNHYQGEDHISASTEIRYWLALMKNSAEDNERFKSYFEIAYNYYRASKYSANPVLTLEDFGRAYELGIIDENEIYKEFMDRPLSPSNIDNLTNSKRREREKALKYPRLFEIGNKAVETIAGIEVIRGELNTEVTHLASKINKCYGTNIFAAIILNLEKDTYVRGYNFVYDDSTKKELLSHLLKCCYPKEGEGANTLRELLKGKKVTDKQLIEAAMYSPQWLDIVSEYLEIDGLKSTCWYFHAHVNEHFSEEKKSIVALYSPLAAEDFRDGAFDQKWFMEAYNTIGDKIFNIVYDSAKYIAGGGLHKRSQLFADATLGKLDANDVKNKIMDKRNKDYLLAYGLIPLKGREDLLNRYEYIHQYIKESRQFGAQRQASEGRSANIALLNLARNAGYSDVNRLTWNMETEKIDSIRTYLNPRNIEDITIFIAIDELGSPEIACNKDGKALKDIPSKLKKHEYVQEIKEVKKSLKDQYVRARHSFEASMENGDEFEALELINLSRNPVLNPIIKNLVFACCGRLGYFRNDSIIDLNGEMHVLRPEDKLMIAHPVHLYESGKWPDYQKDLFNKKLIQPFKQVFRELYMPNEDELREKTQSRRYAGHQIQPKKAAALLKTRGWMASYEEGLQKVYYKENIVATIYALADWFSPSDIEAPTIELVRFEGRKTFKPVLIEEIPKLIFSEVMRDVDLAVSVAHVGGVDPEASLSTVEIRRVIVEELIKLLKLENVSINGTHAYIKGVHGEYTVHLGSGVVHKMGRGSINILPVHSGRRGRIFLPFIDDDPKSAEIISKTILLAEDYKIKDPSILEQICS